MPIHGPCSLRCCQWQWGRPLLLINGLEDQPRVHVDIRLKRSTGSASDERGQEVVQEGRFLRRKGGGSCAGRVQEGSRKGPGRGVPVHEGGGAPVQEGGSWGVPGTVPVQEGGGFLSDMHMPQPTHGAQLKPSDSPPLALPLPLTLGTQY